MFENFPYTDMHQLNLDWIIKIAKDFLEQYTHIQQLISDGETSLQNLTDTGLQELDNKADELTNLLNEWYNTHSSDIANQLASALDDIDEELTTVINSFTTNANRIAQEAAASIPADYSTLSNNVVLLQKNLERNSKFLGAKTYYNRIRDPFQTSDGLRLNANGLAVSDSNYKLVKYSANPGSMFRIVSDDYFQFQNSQSVPSDTTNRIDTTYGVGNFILTAPEGTTTLVFSTPINGSTISVYEYFDDMASIKDNTERTYIFKDCSIGDLLEMGDLYVNNQGDGSFTDALKRIRICKGLPLKLYTGDIIYVSDPQRAVFYVYKYNPITNKYSAVTPGWHNEPIDIREDGDYYIVGRYPTETFITDFEEFRQLFYIKRMLSLFKLSEDITENFADLNSFEYGINSLTDYFEMGDFYVDSDGIGTFYDAIKRIRTKQNEPLHLKAGDVLTISNDFVFLLYQETTADRWQSYRGWGSNPVMITADGNYRIVARYSTEAQITNYYDIASSMKLYRIEGINYVNHNEYGSSDIFYNELQETIASVKNTTANRGLLMAIITDTHVDKNHAGWYDTTLENLNRICNAIPVNGILHLGDIANAYQEPREQVEYNIRYAMNKLLSIDKPITYVMLGNHDDNHFSGDAEMIPDKEMYSLTQRFNERFVNRSLNCAPDGTYEYRSANYYVDYPGLKLRVICFDSTYQHTGFSTEMIAWMRGLMANAPGDYKFVLFTHCGFTVDMNGGYGIANRDLMEALLNDYKTRICCYVCGHTHYDYVNYPLGFAQITMAAATPDQPAQTVPSGAVVPTRVYGTASEVCITLLNIIPNTNTVQLIRFGAGSDRTIPMYN